MVNWTALLGLVQGVSVRKTSRHWIVHVETLYGRYPGELFTLAKNLGDRVAQALMSKYGVLLADGKIGKGYERAIDDPVAKMLSRYFTISTPQRKMDHSPVELEVGGNATAAKMLPGRVVIFDDADQTVKEAGAAAVNVVGFLEVDPAGKKTTVYAVGDQAKVIVDDCFALLTLLASENVTRGDPLVTAADGKVAKQAVAALGSQGMVVGYAWESSNVTVDAEIIVRWKPSAEPAAVA